MQLRLHSNGESSASVAETLAAGIPTVVTNIGTFAEYPDDVVVKVPAGIDDRDLAVVLADLLADAPAPRCAVRRRARPRRGEQLCGGGRHHGRHAGRANPLTPSGTPAGTC